MTEEAPHCPGLEEETPQSFLLDAQGIVMFLKSKLSFFKDDTKTQSLHVSDAISRNLRKRIAHHYLATAASASFVFSPPPPINSLPAKHEDRNSWNRAKHTQTCETGPPPALILLSTGGNSAVLKK